MIPDDKTLQSLSHIPDKVESSARLRRKWEDQLLEWRTAIFIGVNAFILPKIFESVGDSNTAFPLGILSILNCFWVLCSLQSHSSIKMLTIKCVEEHDIGQKIVNTALGDNLFCRIFRPTRIICCYIPIFSLISVSFMWFDLIACCRFQFWAVLKNLFFQPWFIFTPPILCCVIYSTLKLTKKPHKSNY